MTTARLRGSPHVAGVVRVVRSRKRARLLRKRGERLDYYPPTPGCRTCWVWHVVCNNPTRYPYEACAFCGTPLRTNESERAYCPHCNR